MGRRVRVLKYGICEVTQEYKEGKHKGIDIVKEGYMLDFVTSHSAGTIVEVINDCKENTPDDISNPGNMVKIDHGNGYSTRYLHLAYGTVKVRVGERVSKGQILGYMGNTGNSFGGHLHFEVLKDGSQTDPTNYLDNDLPNNEVENTIDNLARDVIEGKYGNGEDRKKALGSKYAEVQRRVNEILTNKVKYLSNKNYKGTSIVDALNQIKVDSSYSYRAKLAKVNGITDYKGTKEQNTKLLNLLKSGTLKSV